MQVLYENRVKPNFTPSRGEKGRASSIKIIVTTSEVACINIAINVYPLGTGRGNEIVAKLYREGVPPLLWKEVTLTESVTMSNLVEHANLKGEDGRWIYSYFHGFGPDRKHLNGHLMRRDMMRYAS